MDKQSKAIANLNELTQHGNLKWQIVDPPDTRGSTDFVGTAFGTDYEDKKLRIFSRRYKVALDEDRFEWQERTVLQVVDSGGGTLYEFPLTMGIGDLLESVQFQSSGVGDLIDKLANLG